MGAIADFFTTLRLGDLVFYAFAALGVVGAAGAAFSRNLVYSAFSLLGALFAVAALFAWLSADYLAITQLVVYVGGILVLFLFAVMLTNRISEVRRSNPSTGTVPAALVSLSIFVLLAWVALGTDWALLAAPQHRETTASIGDALLTTHLLPFEALSVVILAALVGAVIMARKELER